MNIDQTIEERLGFLNHNSAISFARECLRLDPRMRPSCEELMSHDYFNDFREWFEDEIQTLIEYDNQETAAASNGVKATFSTFQRPQILLQNQI
jgi:serine/threonine protein kinase